MTEEEFKTGKSNKLQEDMKIITEASKESPMRLSTSDRIRKRIEAAGKPFFANDTIHEFIEEGELEELKKEAAGHIRGLLQALVIDYQNDHNTQETAERVAKMYIDEIMMGRFTAKPKITEFPNIKKLDEMYISGPIRIRSMCSHHFAPIMGEIWVGVIPGKKVIGLSKFNRLAHWIMSRPQIQEEAIIQLADELEKDLEASGIAIVMKAEHFCMRWRGVKDNSVMVNSVMRGVFAQNPNAKAEFLELIKGAGYGR